MRLYCMRGSLICPNCARPGGQSGKGPGFDSQGEAAMGKMQGRGRDRHRRKPWQSARRIAPNSWHAEGAKVRVRWRRHLETKATIR